MRVAVSLTMASLLLAGVATVERAAAESITEAVEHAVNFHPEMRRDRAFNRAAEKFVDQNYAGYLPGLDIDVASGWEVTNSPTTRAAGFSSRNLWRTDINAVLTQMLFDGFATQNSVAAARFQALASSKTLVASGERIAREASEVYLDLLHAQERLAVAEEDQAELGRIAGLVGGLVNAGRASRVDNDQAVSRVAFSEAELATAQGRVRSAIARYTEIVGKSPGSLMRPDEPQYSEADDLNAAILAGMSENPQAQVTGATMDSRRATAEAARAPYAPRFDLEVSGGVDNNQDGTRGYDTDLSVLVRLRWNLFNGFGDLARVRAATFDTHAAAKDDGEVRRVIREAVRVSFLALQTAKERLEPLQGDAGAARQVFEAYLDQFDIGTRSLLDLLDSRNDLTDAELALITGEYDILQAHYDLLFAMGRLLRELDIIVEPGDADRHDLQVAGADQGSVNLRLASALGDWSTNGIWIGEFAPEGAEDAETQGPVAASEHGDEAVESAELPSLEVEHRPLARGLNQLSETMIEERGPMFEVKRQARLSELPLPDASEVAEPAEVQTVSSMGPAIDSRDAGPAVGNYLSALEALAETVLGLEDETITRGSQLENLAELPSPRE